MSLNPPLSSRIHIARCLSSIHSFHFSLRMPPSRSRLSVPLPSPLLPAHSGAASPLLIPSLLLSACRHLASIQAAVAMKQQGLPSTAQSKWQGGQMMPNPSSFPKMNSNW